LYDTGAVLGDLGAKFENTVACALIRELHFIEDTTGNRVALHFLRDKEKHEVDFLVLIDNMPVTMIEAKGSIQLLKTHPPHPNRLLDSDSFSFTFLFLT